VVLELAVWARSEKLLTCYEISHTASDLGKPEGKRPFGRSRHRWEDNIYMHLREVKAVIAQLV
jgi:hypothetical protein